MAECGDEKNMCDETTTPTTPTPPTPTPPAPMTCDDKGCKEEFKKNGVCVNTSAVNWGTLTDTYDLSAGSIPDRCTSECNCVCLKKMGCPPSKKCVKKKGQCVMPNTSPPPGYFYLGFLCDKKLKCKCYQKCLNPKCEKKGGKCLLSDEKIPSGSKPSGFCNKKAKCMCYTPICSPNKKCSDKGGKCYGPGMEVPQGAKYLGYCNKKQKCKCYKENTTPQGCTTDEITIPASFNDNGNSPLCADKMGILVMRNAAGEIEGYSAAGQCGTMADLPEYRSGGNMAYIGGNLISYGGWYGGTGRFNTWQYETSSNSWSETATMASANHLSTYAGHGTVSLLADGTQLAQYYSSYYGAPWLIHSYNPSAVPAWSNFASKMPKPSLLNLASFVVSAGHYNIVIWGPNGGKVFKHHPTTNTYVALADLPGTPTSDPEASLMERPAGTGIVIVYGTGEVWFCLLEDLGSTAGWSQLPSIPSTSSFQEGAVGLVEGHLYVVNPGDYAWKWDEGTTSWVSAPAPGSVSPSRSTYTRVPKTLIPGC